MILCLGVSICVVKVYRLLYVSITVRYDIPICMLTTPNETRNFIFSILDGLLYCLIPFCLITILNMMILKKMNSKKALRARSQVQSRSSTHRDRSLVPMMLAVSLVFAVTTFPFALLLMRQS